MIMASVWFYVENGERKGPIEESALIHLIKDGTIKEDSFVWKKGFQDWTKLGALAEFHQHFGHGPTHFDWNKVSKEKNIFYLLTGKDRSNKSRQYGPFSLNMIKDLFQENRINAKTFIWTKGMDGWKVLADVPLFYELFGKVPPQLTEKDRRLNRRRPFVARIFFHNESTLYEGLCRDISLGGMQVLVAGLSLKVGEAISLNVHPENSDYNFVTSGKVVRLLEGGLGFSLRFENLSVEAKNAIISYINDVDMMKDNVAEA